MTHVLSGSCRVHRPEVFRGKSRAIAVPEANTTHAGLGRSPRQTRSRGENALRVAVSASLALARPRLIRGFLERTSLQRNALERLVTSAATKLAFQTRDQACGRAATHVPRPRRARTLSWSCLPWGTLSPRLHRVSTVPLGRESLPAENFFGERGRTPSLPSLSTGKNPQNTLR